jgi:hypothetical protein
MDAERFISRILDDEGLTSGLNDPEARLLVEWLVDQVERIAGPATDEDSAWNQVGALCRHARAIRRFVELWCLSGDHGAAAQLAAAERFTWPLPVSDENDAFDVLQAILNWETKNGPPPAPEAKEEAVKNKQ